jgi:hypothetical protein
MVSPCYAQICGTSAQVIHRFMHRHSPACSGNGGENVYVTHGSEEIAEAVLTRCNYAAVIIQALRDGKRLLQER